MSSRWSMRHDDVYWAHAAHPASLWTRLLTLPLFAPILWVREDLGATWIALALALLLLGWIAARAFPATRSDAWTTRAVLGERIHAAKGRWPLPDGSHTKTVAGMIVGSVGTVIMVGGSIVYDPVSTVIGVGIMIGAKVATYAHLAGVYDEVAARHPDVRAWTA